MGGHLLAAKTCPFGPVLAAITGPEWGTVLGGTTPRLTTPPPLPAPNDLEDRSVFDKTRGSPAGGLINTGGRGWLKRTLLNQRLRGNKPPAPLPPPQSSPTHPRRAQFYMEPTIPEGSSPPGGRELAESSPERSTDTMATQSREEFNAPRSIMM